MGSHEVMGDDVLGEDFRVQVEDLRLTAGLGDVLGAVVRAMVGSVRVCLGHASTPGR
jgi:hypothetical protein